MSINSCSNFLITVFDDSFCNGIQKGKLENLSTIIKNFFPLHSKTSVDNFSNGLLAYVLTRGSFCWEGRYLMQSKHVEHISFIALLISGQKYLTRPIAKVRAEPWWPECKFFNIQLLAFAGTTIFHLAKWFCPWLINRSILEWKIWFHLNLQEMAFLFCEFSLSVSCNGHLVL